MVQYLTIGPTKKALRRGVLWHDREIKYHHSFVTFTVNVWNGNSSPSLGNIS